MANLGYPKLIKALESLPNILVVSMSMCVCVCVCVSFFSHNRLAAKVLIRFKCYESILLKLSTQIRGEGASRTILPKLGPPAGTCQIYDPFHMGNKT